MLEIDKITAWISEGIDVVKYNLSALVLLFFCVMVGALISIGILAGPLCCGFLMILFRMIEDKRKGVVATPTHPQDLLKGFDYFAQSLLVCCVFLAVMVLRAAFLSVTGSDIGIIWNFVFLALATLMIFALPLIVTHNYTAIDAVKASYAVTSKNPLTFCVFLLIFGIVRFVISYIVAVIFGGVPFVAFVLNFAAALAINLLALTSIAVAHLEVFGKKPDPQV